MASTEAHPEVTDGATGVPSLQKDNQMPLKKKTVLAAAVAMIGATTLAVGSGMVLSPASAALPTCNRTTGLDSGHIGDIEVPSAGTTDASTSCVMGRGANSKAVKRLQYTLNVCYARHLT